MLQGGVDLSHVIWAPFDGIGRNTRVGLNFTEKGFGIRAAVGCSDRGLSAASQIKPGDVNWEKLFGEEGVRWFHTGGIFAALSANTAESGDRGGGGGARSTARSSPTISTTAPSLWKIQGGKEGAQEVNRHDRVARRRDDRQRGGLHRCLGFEVRAWTSTSRSSTRRTSRR